MNTKKLIIIAIVTVLVVLVAYKSAHNVVNTTVSTSKNGKKLLPDLEKNADNVGAVMILSKGKSFKLHFENVQWLIINKYSYPVGVEKIRDLVQNSANIRIIEKKTANAAELEDLGLDDPEKETSNAIRVVLMSGDEKTTYADYIRGVSRKGVRSKEPRNELYSRMFNDTQSYLVYADLSFDLNAHALLSGETFSIKYDKFQSVNFNYPGHAADNFTLEKGLPTELDFAITQPAGSVIKSWGKANAIGTSLEYMSLEDIVPVEKFQIKEPEVIITYETFAGLTMIVTLFKKDQDNWLSFKASADEGNKLSSEEAGRINTLASKWVYKVDFKSTGGFYYKLADLVKE